MRGSFLVAYLVAACDPLASSDYVGEPMFTLDGTFASTTGPDEPLGGLALMWQDTSGPGGPGIAATAVPVSIAFPATFRVSVPLPPPEVARFAFANGDPELAEAYVFVVDDPSASQLVPAGLDRQHVLIYASADVAAGTMAADYLGGPVTAGYHLRSFASVATTGPAQSAMIEQCVASGAARTACETRRAYQLGSIADDEPLRIVVTPP